MVYVKKLQKMYLLQIHCSVQGMHSLQLHKLKIKQIGLHIQKQTKTNAFLKMQHPFISLLNTFQKQTFVVPSWKWCAIICSFC